MDFDSNLFDDDFEFDIRLQRRRNTYLRRVNFNLEDPYFVEKFRIPRVCVEFLIERLGSFLQHASYCNQYALTPLQQILLTLHWLGNGAQYHGVGVMHGVSKATLCRCVNKVSYLISHHLLREEVRWPENSSNVAQGFFNIAGMPLVAGAVDGTLIPIDAPSVNEQAFVDRKGHHSLNVMVVAGPDYRFYAVNSNFPGSVHDSRVLQRSSFYSRWNDEGWRPFPNAIIIGDSGYPLRKWLFTPNIPNAIGESRAKNRFLAKIKRTRQVVECSLGQLKEIFPCLNKLRLKKVVSCARVVNACITLYNIRKRISNEYDEYSWTDDEDFDIENEGINDDDNDYGTVETLRCYINRF